MVYTYAVEVYNFHFETKLISRSFHASILYPCVFETEKQFRTYSKFSKCKLCNEGKGYKITISLEMLNRLQIFSGDKIGMTTLTENRLYFISH